MTVSDPGGLSDTRVGLDETLTLQLVEERVGITKRRVATGTVRLATLTETIEEIAEIDLDRYRVEVIRVPVGRVVDSAPAARVEGNTTIVPVVEERFVVVKQLFLAEEVHIRHIVERETVTEPITLRRQHATVERRDASGNTTGDPDPL